MRKVLFFLSLASAGLFAAAYRSARIDVGDVSDGTVAAELRVIENALVAKQQNFALKVVRNLIPRVSGLRLVTPGSIDVQEASSDIASVAQSASTSSSTGSASTTTSSTTTASSTSSGSSSTSTSGASTDVVSPTKYSKTKLASLKDEVDALARPFSTIDDLWDDDDKTKQANCVAEYKAQLDRVVLWITRNAGFFVMPEWNGLVKYIYDNLVSYSVRGGLTNPLKISRLGEGICGKNYYSVYDQAVGALKAIMLKFGSMYEIEIQALIKKVETARESSWGGLKL
jgi:hypothetical protein